MEGLSLIYVASFSECCDGSLALNSPESFSAPVSKAVCVKIASVATACSVLATGSAAYAMVRNGDSCDAVMSIQQALIESGYNPGPIDGIFGFFTETAVIQFQQDFGLSSDGIVGSNTAMALRLSSSISCGGGAGGGAVLRFGTTSQGVTVVQDQLKALGFLSGSVPSTGYFGELTEEAVIAFQSYWGLPTDGVVGPDTSSALFRDDSVGQAGGAGNTPVSYAQVIYRVDGEAGASGGEPDGALAFEMFIVTTVIDPLNVRDSPDINAPVIGARLSGEMVRASTSTIRGWRQLETGGWVTAHFLSRP